MTHKNFAVRTSMHTANIAGTSIIIRRLEMADIHLLEHYLAGLSQQTRNRFGPHQFDSASLHSIFHDQTSHKGFIAIETETGRIIAYAIVRMGFLPHDAPRLETYELHLHPRTDATYAPSVADEWQGKGLGILLFQYMLEYLQQEGIQRIILWGGVQASNEKAVRYYQRLGFHTLGAFEYHGMNLDMIYHTGNFLPVP
jgi:GNAT superfamily N-acetyltransferase